MAFIEIPITKWCSVYANGYPTEYSIGNTMTFGYDTCLALEINVPTSYPTGFANVQISLDAESYAWDTEIVSLYYSTVGTYNPGAIESAGFQLCSFYLPTASSGWTTYTRTNINPSRPNLGVGYIYLVYQGPHQYYGSYIKAGNIRFWLDVSENNTIRTRGSGAWNLKPVKFRKSGAWADGQAQFRRSGTWVTGY